MATYCFRCKNCGDTREAGHPKALLGDECINADGVYTRDYRAEQTQLVVPGEFLHNPLPEDGPVV